MPPPPPTVAAQSKALVCVLLLRQRARILQGAWILSLGIVLYVSHRGQVHQSPSTPTVSRWEDIKTRKKKVKLGARVLCAAASSLCMLQRLVSAA